MSEDYCFSESVARKTKPTKTEDLDPEVNEILGRIESAWRKAHKNLRGLVFKGKEPGIIAESTWHSWRKGETSPKYVELRDVAKAAGLDVTPFGLVAKEQSVFISHLHRDTQDVVRWMESRLKTDDERAAIKLLVEDELMKKVAVRPRAEGEPLGEPSSQQPAAGQGPHRKRGHG